MSKSTASLVVIQRRGLVLGVSRKHDYTQWGLPGGKVETGEYIVDAAERELLEETGINKSEIKGSYLRGPIYEAKVKSTFVYTFELEYPEHYEFLIRNTEEGLVSWITWAHLFDGPFGDYNVEVYKQLYK